jgi:hypothetical protein
VARPPAATVVEQQMDFDVWREDFNTIRPHEALGQRCPAEFYAPSPRCYPEKITVWEYPADHQVRRVGGDGYIKWRDGTIDLSEAMRKETIALAQRDDGNWAIRFRNFDLGTLSPRRGVKSDVLVWSDRVRPDRNPRQKRPGRGGSRFR